MATLACQSHYAHGEPKAGRLDCTIKNGANSGTDWDLYIAVNGGRLYLSKQEARNLSAALAEHAQVTLVVETHDGATFRFTNPKSYREE